jgi:glycosyltransferase involved in cell wall biosynthesis
VARAIGETSFVISTNGFADGPAQALCDYLLDRGAEALTLVNHPLVPEAGNEHVISSYAGGKLTDRRAVSLPNRPPLTFALDVLVPLRLPRCDVWFGFNNLACARGLVLRRLGRVDKAFYWAVDFVPERFGAGLLTSLYNRLDRHVCLHADGRIELSEAALEGRNDYLGLGPQMATRALVAPMGAWLDRTPRAGADSWERRRVVYLGHLVERQGVDRLLEALALLAARSVEVTADIVGGGPLEQTLRSRATELGLDGQVRFHGFVADHREVEALLATGTVAVAPYLMAEANFSRFADPGKLKAYLGAALPIVLTPVPPNAAEIANAGAGRIVTDDPAAIADGIEGLLDRREAWLAAHAAAEEYAKAFDWNAILSRTLDAFGLA